jgi:hypothetical protein
MVPRKPGRDPGDVLWNNYPRALSPRGCLGDSSSYQIWEVVFWLAMGDQLRAASIAEVK